MWKLRAELQDLKFKADGTAARKSVLEKEVGGLKEKLGVLLQKTETDDRLIEALRGELRSLRGSSAAGSRAPSAAAPGAAGGGGGPSAAAVGVELQQEVVRLRRAVAEQAEQISRQEAIIHALQETEQNLGAFEDES